MTARVITAKRVSSGRIEARVALALALRMRVEGRGFDEIAEACGYSDARHARGAISAVLQTMVRQPAEELRQIEKLNLDRIHSELYIMFMNPNAKVLERLAVVDRMLRLSERRSKLLGLDVPAEVDTFEFAYRMAKKGGRTDDEANEIASESVRFANELEQAQRFQLTAGEDAPEAQILDQDPA